MLDATGRLPSGPVTYEMRNGLRYRMRAASADVGVLYETWVLDSYSLPGSRLPTDAIVVDVGAHVGTFTLRAAREAPMGHVYSFEPTTENSRLLTENVKLNGADNVTVIRAAMGGKPGRATISLDPQSNAMHSLYAAQGSSGHEEVDVVTLDGFMADRDLRRIDLLKLDCEGAEYEILLGADPQTLSRIRSIALEYHDVAGAPPISRLEDHLRSQGFTTQRDDSITPMVYARRDA